MAQWRPCSEDFEAKRADTSSRWEEWNLAKIKKLRQHLTQKTIFSLDVDYKVECYVCYMPMGHNGTKKKLTVRSPPNNAACIFTLDVMLHLIYRANAKRGVPQMFAWYAMFSQRLWAAMIDTKADESVLTIWNETLQTKKSFYLLMLMSISGFIMILPPIFLESRSSRGSSNRLHL